MKGSTLTRLFNPERLKTLDPNKPEVQPLLKQEAALRNQALVRWYEEVGHYLIDSTEQGIISKVIRAIGHKRNTVEERNANLRLLDEIARDIKFVDHITNAYEQEEKRKKE